MIRTAVAAATVAVALTGAAVAEDSIVIDTSEVDFTNTSEVEAVYAKIVEASETVCADLYLHGAQARFTLGAAPRMYEACVAQTVEDTVLAADEPALTAFHEMEPAEDFTIALAD